MRCFLGINLPDDVKDELVRIQNEITYDGKIKFIEKDNLHLTLKFFGEISEKKAGEIQSALKNISFSPIKTNLSQLGVFPDEQRIRVIWVGLSPDEEIQSLFKQMEEGLEPLGIKREDRPFTSHVTIGRVKFLKDKKGLTDSIQQIKVEPTPLTISNFSLKESTLTPKGSIYKDLSSYSAS